MGYFANGTEGAIYEERYCQHCLHGNGEGAGECAVWTAHLFHNYTDAAQPVLDMLIPRVAKGTRNGQCEMFRKDPTR